MPQWEHINAKVDIDYANLKKRESTNILAIKVRQHLINNYQKHIKIFTGLIRQGNRIRHSWLKSAKVFLLRDGFFHIHIRVVRNINGIKLHIMQYSITNIFIFIFICVDSKSVLYALKNGL